MIETFLLLAAQIPAPDPTGMVSVGLFWAIVSAMGIAIITLSGVFYKLFFEERALNERLRATMREDDQKVIQVLLEVQRFMLEQKNNTRPYDERAQILRILEDIKTMITSIQMRVDSLEKTRSDGNV